MRQNDQAEGGQKETGQSPEASEQLPIILRHGSSSNKLLHNGLCDGAHVALCAAFMPVKGRR